MKKYTTHIASLALACALAACGGGGGDSVGGGGGPAVPAWQVAQLLEATNGQADQVDVSINADGVGYAVWIQSHGNGQDVFASRYLNGQWGEALPVTDSGAIESNPQVAVLPNGEALVVWQQTTQAGGAVNLFYTQSSNGKWINGASFLQLGVGAVNDLELEADSQGNAMAVWSRIVDPAANPVSRQIFASAYKFSDGLFEAVAQKINEGTTDAQQPDVAIDAAGNVLAVWTQLDGPDARYRILARPYVGGFWKPSQTISDPNEAIDSTEPQVAAGTDGVASVVWERNDQSVEMNTSTKFTSGDLADWRGVEIVDGRGESAAISVDGLGTTTVVYQQTENGVLKLKSRRRLASGQVSSPALGGGTAPAGALRLGSGADGHAIAVWSQRFPDSAVVRNVVASRLDPSTGEWSTTELIESEERGSASDLMLALAVNSKGSAVAGWGQLDGTFSNGVPIQSVTANIFK